MAAHCAIAWSGSAPTADGGGLVALSYRGYGGSSGRPTEDGLITDANTTYDYATARYSPERIVLWGESRGTGVAVALAADKPVGRVILQSPFTSTADIAAGPLLVCAGAAPHEGPVPFGPAHRQGDGARPGDAWRTRPRRADRARRTAVRDDPGAEGLRFPDAEEPHLDLSAHGANEIALEFIDGKISLR